MLSWLYPNGSILPADFTQELSQYEILSKVLVEIKNLDEKIDSVAKTGQAYTDNKFNLAMQSVTQLGKNLTDYINQTSESDRAYTDGMLKIAKQYTDGEILSVKQWFTAQNNILSNMLMQEMDNLETKINQLNYEQRLWVMEQINEMWLKINELGKGVIINDPLTQNPVSLQTWADKMWNIISKYAITCGEYDSLGLTCSEYDNKEITCWEYDAKAKKYLTKDRRFWVYNPMTGMQEYYKETLSWLESLHRTNALTCEEYDNKNLTCEEYDDEDVTCYQYDWNSLTEFEP